MAKEKEIELGCKIWLIEECLAKRMRGREAARRVGVSCSCMQNMFDCLLSPKTRLRILSQN